MKAEFTAFNQYAYELYQDKFLSKEDVQRVYHSLESKSHGFIRDMDELANDIRTALSDGVFRLTEHTRRVFRRSRGSVLPRFLWGALSKVFTSSGEVRDDMSAYHAATCIQFLSALKRVDPPANLRADLETKVWSSLEENFADEQRVLEAVSNSLAKDLHFRGIFFSAREHFRRIMLRAKMSPRAAFGPGKNLDRYEAITAMDWYVADPPHLWNFWNPFPEFMREFVDECRRYINYSPRGTQAAGGRYPVTLGDPVMKCSAQPKSYKAFRGVGVTSAYRMALQIALQRSFYESALDQSLPLRDQAEMQENLRQNFWSIGTVDLSSASDRCYWSLLYSFGKGTPFFDACYALRTQWLDLPTGRVRCASPVMGEAITFPLMSAFFASISLAVCDHVGWGHEFVRVYGDDIQHPHYDLMVSVLEKFGAKPSITKSYPPHSLFKESCEAHYVAGKEDMLRNARPCFLPSLSFNYRGRIGHADAFKFLTLAKESFFRDGAMSRACVKFVEEYLPSLKIPCVPVNSPYLGRPTLSRFGGQYLQVEMREESAHYMSSRGIRRLALRAPDIHVDAKLHHKYQFRLMSKGISRLSVRDHLQSLELDIFCLAARQSKKHHLLKDDMRPQDLRAYLLQHLSDEEICEAIASVRLLIQCTQSR